MIMALFKYFKKFEHTVSKSAQSGGLKEVEENEVKKQLQNISEPQPKKNKDNAMVMATSFSEQKLSNGVLPMG